MEENIEVAAINECGICCENFNNSSRKKIYCPTCPNGSEPVCSKCVERYLIDDTINSAHCMKCKKEWSNEFLSSVTSKTFYTQKYRKHVQKISLDREKSKLQQTMPLLERYKIKQNILKEKEELMAEKERLVARLLEIKGRISEINYIVSRGEFEIEGTDKPDEKSEKESKYMMGCPTENCRGFIRGNTWDCAICEVRICAKCYTERKKDSQHICKDDDMKSAEEIKKNTKQCPKCNTRIFKIDGCDIMFCTSCNTGFNWKTLELVRNNIHNPHYFDFINKLRQSGQNVDGMYGGGLIQNIQDECNRIPQYYSIIENIQKSELIEILSMYYRRVMELDSTIRYNRINDDFSDLRLKYLTNEFDDEKLKAEIFRRDRKNEKCMIINQILQTFMATMVDRFRTIIEVMKNKKDIKSNETKFLEIIEEMNVMLKIVNESLKTNILNLGYTKYPIIDLYGGYALIDKEKTGRTRKSKEENSEESEEIEQKKKSKSKRKARKIEDSDE